MPAPRITSGGSTVIPTRSLLPSASRHSRKHTVRTTVRRSMLVARTLMPSSGLSLAFGQETRSGLVGFAPRGEAARRSCRLPYRCIDHRLGGRLVFDDVQIHVLE